MGKKGFNANYNFEVQKEPRKRMGENDFANLPPDCKILIFKNEPEYRGGIPNRFDAGAQDISGIYENERDPDGYA